MYGFVARGFSESPWEIPWNWDHCGEGSACEVAISWCLQFLKMCKGKPGEVPLSSMIKPSRCGHWPGSYPRSWQSAADGLGSTSLDLQGVENLEETQDVSYCRNHLSFGGNVWRWLTDNNTLRGMEYWKRPVHTMNLLPRIIWIVEIKHLAEKLRQDIHSLQDFAWAQASDLSSRPRI